jgi:RHS repeat-associated protein
LDDLTLVCQNGTISSGACGGGGQSRSFTYDSLKRLVQAVNPESGTITYSYDTSGNLSTRKDNRSITTTFSAYDGLNRVTGKSYSDGTPSVAYSYGDSQTTCNMRGRLMQVTTASAPPMTNNYTCYDWAGRAISNDQITGLHTYGMSYAYNLAGKMKSATLPSGRQQSISYDIADRPSGVSGTYGTTTSTYASSFGWFANGALANVSLGPGPTNYLPQQYCQNTRLQITNVRLGQPGGGTTTGCVSSNDLLNLAYTYGSQYGNNGNVTQEVLLPLNVTQTFTYDAYDRLATAKEGTGWLQTYGYDAYGNRWVDPSHSNGFPLASFTPQSSSWFNSSNQLSNTGLGIGYDNAGNLQKIGVYSYTYDAENRQTGVTINGAASTYSYDGEGRRVQKVASGVTTVYVYDASGEVAAEYSTSPPTQAQTLYPTADPLGSTRLVTSATGTETSCHDYLPFGEEIPSGLDGRGSCYSATDSVTHKFTGKERDAETGDSSATQAADYFEARYLSGTIGRFASPDPVFFTPERVHDPQQLNRYAYVRNNPLRLIDPSGEDLYCTGDNQAGCFQALQQIAGDAANRLSIDKVTGEVEFDTTDLDLSSNEGAALISQLVESGNAYAATIGDTVETAGGSSPVGLTANLPLGSDQMPIRPNKRYNPLLNQPRSGVADQVAVNPDAHYYDTQGRSVLVPSLLFHELAEAYAKIDGGRPYEAHETLGVENGMVLTGQEGPTGAHWVAVEREIKLREERPNLTSGRAGDTLARDPHK